MGYRASRQASTKHSPYFMLFQQHMRLPIDNEVLPEVENEQENVELDDLMTKLLKSREEAFNKAELNIGVAQNKQKEAYDRKHLPVILREGTEVLLKNTKEKQRKGGKLERLWLGPYTIHTHLGKGVYKLKKQGWRPIEEKGQHQQIKVVYSEREKRGI